MQETQERWVQSLGWENPLEEDMAIHSSIFPGKIPWTEEPGRQQSMELQKGWSWPRDSTHRGISFCYLWHRNTALLKLYLNFPDGSMVKNLPAMQGRQVQDASSTRGLWRCSGEGNGNPLQYTYLGSLVVRGVWQAKVHGVARVGHNLATKLPPAPIQPWAQTGLNQGTNHSGQKGGIM